MCMQYAHATAMQWLHFTILLQWMGNGNGNTEMKWYTHLPGPWQFGSGDLFVHFAQFSFSYSRCEAGRGETKKNLSAIRQRERPNEGDFVFFFFIKFILYLLKYFERVRYGVLQAWHNHSDGFSIRNGMVGHVYALLCIWYVTCVGWNRLSKSLSTIVRNA